MSLTKSVIEPTEELLYDEIITNKLNRNEEIYNFVDLLYSASIYSSIAFNGTWGSGKTFFIKKVKMIIDSFDINSNIQDTHRTKIVEMIDNLPSTLSGLKENNKLVACYYDAWLYDDSDDPIKSFLYFLATTYCNSYDKESKPFYEKITSIIDVLNFWTNGSTKDLIESFKQDTKINSIYDIETIKKQIKFALEDMLLPEQRLIVFVDELDRCNPQYAVKFLEKVKHFFNNDKVLFVFSINAEQLTATIKNYYGSEIEAGNYLNKLFDLVVDLPMMTKENYNQLFNIYDNSEYLSSFNNYLINNLKPCSRDIGRYIDSMNIVNSYIYNDFMKPISYSNSRIIQVSEVVIAPVIICLKSTDFTMYSKFIKGEAAEYFYQLINKWKYFQDLIKTFLLKDTVEKVDVETEKSAAYFLYDFINSRFEPNVPDNFKQGFTSYDRDIAKRKINSICSLISIGHDYKKD